MPKRKTPPKFKSKIAPEEKYSDVADGSISSSDIVKHGADHEDGPLVEVSLPSAMDFPVRDTSHMYAASETVRCATKYGCVPCSYKIALFDVALDKEFCRQVPNQRPEQCPRLAAIQNATNVETTSHSSMGYHPGLSVLTVGDGDFSFSLAVARIVLSSNNKLANNSRLVATSYESEETLRRIYPNFDETLEELHRLGATTLFQVDATRLGQETFLADQGPAIHFDRICWNFPCTAIAKGQDGQNKEMEQNKELVRRFVISANALLEAGGEIHICHKTKPPFNQWKLEHVALEGLANSNELVPMVYMGRIVLDRALLPPYIPRKALDRKSFPCHDACFYIFRTQASSTRKGEDFTILPLTNVLSAAFLNGDTSPDGQYLVPVATGLIQAIRSECLNSQGQSGVENARRSRTNCKSNRKRARYFR